MQSSDETTRCYFVSTQLSNHIISFDFGGFYFCVLGHAQIQRLGVTCRAADDIPLLDDLSRPLISFLKARGWGQGGKAEGIADETLPHF